MQIASCRVALAGDLHNVVVKPAVSPAEITILRAIHGAGSVTAVSVITEGRVSHKAERNRLRGKYNRKLVDALFPGAIAHLPETVEEVEELEVEEADLPDDEEGFGRTPHVLDLLKDRAKDFGEAQAGELTGDLADVFGTGDPAEGDDGEGGSGLPGEGENGGAGEEE